MWLPQVDVTTRDGQLLVHADLPGLKQDDVKVTVHEGLLTITGERHDTHEEKRGGVFRRERSYGSFRRQIALPEGVDPESIKAHFENGVLEIAMPMPKETAQQGRTIPIQPKAAGGPDVH
jgi:HSP20 family protein